MAMPIPFVPPFVNLGFWGVFFVASSDLGIKFSASTVRTLAFPESSAATWEWWSPWPLRALGVPKLIPLPLVMPIAMTAMACSNLVG